ncbi:hypothetical protein [Antarcticibacterium arcticum]|uniref:hypothetical protein n=1 Tax=Antarcticibacterium arcticum TaxID=2585771 RepID=UPI00196AE498|nr:hypothetical protein [Antarcticibacterium arcticum]
MVFFRLPIKDQLTFTRAIAALYDIVQRLRKVFAVSADNLWNDSENSGVELQNHELNEQLMLINQLDEDEKNALVKIINSMLTKKE